MFAKDGTQQTLSEPRNKRHSTEKQKSGIPQSLMTLCGSLRIIGEIKSCFTSFFSFLTSGYLISIMESVF